MSRKFRNKICQVIPKEKNLQKEASSRRSSPKMKQSPNWKGFDTPPKPEIGSQCAQLALWLNPSSQPEIRSKIAAHCAQDEGSGLLDMECPHIRRLLCPRDDRSRHTTDSFISGWLGLNLRPWMVVRRFCDLGWVNVCVNEYLGLKKFCRVVDVVSYRWNLNFNIKSGLLVEWLWYYLIIWKLKSQYNHGTHIDENNLNFSIYRLRKFDIFENISNVYSRPKFVTTAEKNNLQK